MTKKRLAAPLEELITVGKSFYERIWIRGATGNFSAVVCRRPFEWAITKSGKHRQSLTRSDFVYLNEDGRPRDATCSAPPESLFHLAIISNAGAGAVLQTHSVWSTVLSDAYSPAGGIELEGFDVLKSLSRARAAYPVEWVPILQRTEDHRALAETVGRLLKKQPEIHAVLVRKHGLYTWGSTVQEAAHHMEIFELLFEVVVRQLHIFSQVDVQRTSAARF